MKKLSKVIKAVFAALLIFAFCFAVGCGGTGGGGGGGTGGPRVNRGLGLNGGGTPTAPRGDEEWNEFKLYGTAGVRTPELATGVTVLKAAPQFPSNRQNAAGYYPIGNINNSAGVQICYDVTVSEDAKVGLYAEFGNRNDTRNFDECFTLSVNGAQVQVKDVAMPAYYDDYTPNNKFIFLSFINLKADKVNSIVLELTAEDKFGYNFYGYKFTAEKAEVKMDTSSVIPPDELVEKGYLRYKGEERVTISGGSTKHVKIDGKIDTGMWGGRANRLYSKKGMDGTFTLTIDRSELDDVSKVGLLINHNIARTGAVLEYSTDNAVWQTLAVYADESAGGKNPLKGDYAVQVDQCEDKWLMSFGKGDFDDKNVWACFFEIGKYFGEDKILYVRASYDGVGDAGCDWLGSFSIFDMLGLGESGNPPVPPEHTCESKCPVCGKCTNESCNQPQCSDKCPGHNPDPDEPKDAQWTQHTFYAVSAPGSARLAGGVEITAGNASFPTSRANAQGYYPIGGMNDSEAFTVTYNVDVNADAEVGIYLELCNRKEARTFDKVFELTVDGTKVESTVALPVNSNDFTPTNEYVFIGFAELKAEKTNKVVLDFIEEKHYGYNVYGMRFTAQTAQISLHPSDEQAALIDKGYVKYKGEERVTITNGTPYIIKGNGVNNNVWKSDIGARRLYADNNGEYFTLAIDRSYLDNVSKVGLLLNHNIDRPGGKLEYSTDGENWTQFAKSGEDSFKGAYSVETDLCEDSWMMNVKKGDFTDANVYSCFFEIGQYFGEGKVLYIRASADGGAGCDWLGSFSIFDYLEVIGNA